MISLGIIQIKIMIIQITNMSHKYIITSISSFPKIGPYLLSNYPITFLSRYYCYPFSQSELYLYFIPALFISSALVIASGNTISLNLSLNLLLYFTLLPTFSLPILLAAILISDHQLTFTYVFFKTIAL